MTNRQTVIAYYRQHPASLPSILAMNEVNYRGFVDPMTVVTKECPLCETVFESPRYYNKKYCSDRCRRRAKNYRSTKRYQDLHESVFNKDSQFFLQITNPTLEQLQKSAKLILDEATNDKPICVRGLIPPWTPPDGLVWQEQQRLTPDELTSFVMFHPAMLE